jgi:pimeloyl-ACP methyl ester carboxylesterase
MEATVKRGSIPTVLTLVLAGLLWLPAPATPAVAGVDCEPVAFQVQTPTRHTLRGTLCRPDSSQPQATVLLVHGSTYSSTYWNPGVDPDRYSALRLLAAHGYLTVAIDRLGSGHSDRPPSGQVTADASAAALRDVTRQLRRTYRTVSGKLLAVGHSSGSSLLIRTAAKHGGIDGLVATGFLHTLSPADLFSPMLYPAAADPRFADDPTIPADYVTGRSGLHRMMLYGWNADEAVMRLDERALKDAMPETDAGGFLDEVGFGAVGPFSPRLRIPVLVLVGAEDLTYCTPPSCPEADLEAGFYPASGDVKVEARPRTEHSLNLHLDAAGTTGLIGGWLDQHSEAAGG